MCYIMPQKLITAFIFIALHLCAYAAPTAVMLGARHFSTIDGLQGNTIKAMVQDDDGLIWLGGTGGLNRFDGYHFTDFTRVGLDRNAVTTRHIGLLNLDRKNNMLWTTTSTYSHGCLNLLTGRYEDYTGKGDMNRAFDKYVFTGEDMWLYTKGFGIRHIACRNGRFTMTDYTRQNGKLRESSVLALAEGRHRQIWGITEHTVFRIAENGACHELLKGIQPLHIRYDRGRACVVTKTNDVIVFSEQGKVAFRSHLPVARGIIGDATHTLVCQNLLYIFTPRETFTLNLTTRAFALPSTQIPGGISQGSIPDCQFVANRQSGMLWLFPDKGAPRCLDLLPNIGPNAEKGRIFNVVKDRDGHYVIASYGGGLFIYNPQDHHLQHFTAEDDDPLFFSNYLYAIMADATGCLWVAAESAGVSCINPRQEATAEYVYPHPGLKGDRSNYIRNIIRSRDGNILLNTNDNKLYLFNPATRQLTFKENTKAAIYAYLVDSSGREWVGTRGDGLYVDKQRYAKESPTHVVPVNDFYDIKEDAHHRLWIATWKGGLLCATGGKGHPITFRQFLTHNNNAAKIHDLELSPDGRLYIATYDGLYAVDTRRQHITENDFMAYKVDNKQLPANEIYCLKRDARGALWVGCLGNGALQCTFSQDHKTLTYKAITRANGLANNNVLGIIEDAHHHLWFSTEQGITKLDSRYNTRTYLFSKNVLSNSYSENSGLLLSDGRILFGTMNGLCIVDNITKTGNHPSTVRMPVITNLLIDGKSVLEQSDDTPPIGIMQRRRIDLTHTQNTLSINFSNFNYLDMESTLYQYYMEGVENTWRPPTNANHADYGELRPGRYTFHLKAANNGVWSKPTALTIVIHQPWYNTWWAWMVYLLLAAAITHRLYRLWRDNLQLQQEMKIERQTNEYRQYRLADEIMRNFCPDDYNDSLVVIVESNDDERRQIEQEFGSKLHISAFARGDEALEFISRQRPALLICDERLEDMSGYALIARVKQDEATSSLPIIMLTRLSDNAFGTEDDDKQMENYAAGADDFLSKPYHLHLLLARTIQLISWSRQEKVAETISGEATTARPPRATGSDNGPQPSVTTSLTTDKEPLDTGPAQAYGHAEKTDADAAATDPEARLSERDLRFKRQLDFLMAQHLSDHDYTIDDLASALQMGHTKFYGRVKEVTGISPNKYMMKMRMSTAAELILDGRFNISEVSYKVGFLDQSYFNKCFKRQYGVAPSRYGK